MAYKKEYNIFDDIKAIYLKNNKTYNRNKQSYQIYAILKWLSYDEDNLEIINKLLQYIYYVPSDIFYIMLFLAIEKKDKVPFLHKIHKEDEEKISELYKEISKILDLSNKELRSISHVLDKTILPNKKYWEKELGIN